MNNDPSPPFVPQPCRFCAIASGQAKTAHDRIVMETDEYFAIASVGGFVDGWTLVCPKAHAFNLADDMRSRVFHDFVAMVSDAVAEAYGSVVAFEHGARAAGSLTGCGTDHAHLHLVPFSGSIVEAVKESAAGRMWTDVSASEVSEFTGSREYLLMTDEPVRLAASVSVSVVEKPESQFFRRIIAEKLGLSSVADYRRHPFFDRAAETAERVASQALALNALPA